eukprot:jgi/Psemu1/257624/estExt_Genewise1Plus.C_2340034
MDAENEETVVANTTSERQSEKTAHEASHHQHKHNKVSKKKRYFCPHNLNERDEDENTPIHVAIHCQKLEHVKLLCKAGASLHKKSDGSPPIHVAISMGAIPQHRAFAIECVRVLYKNDADLAAKDDALHTPLSIACMYNLPEIVKFILSTDAGSSTLNVRADRSQGRALHMAAKFDTIMTGANRTTAATTGHARTVTEILVTNPNIEIDAQNSVGQTPMHIACSRGNWNVVRLLLKKGADPAIADRRGFTPGQHAHKRGMPIPNDLLKTLGGPPRAALVDVLKCHEYSYVESISQMCSSIPDHPSAVANLDADTTMSRWSFEAALRAAGSVCEAVDKVVSGDNRNAFCVVRPPGHHAGPRGIVRCENDPDGGSHGFCFLNNVAIGAAYARSMYRNEGIQKIAIVDFDVHHGNGTEEIVRQLVPTNVFFASTHGYGPRDDAKGNCCKIINCGLGLPTRDAVPGMQRLEVRDTYRKKILPLLREFDPDIIFVSAGFDAHKRDSMNFGYVGMVEDDYEWVTEQLVRLANTCCNGRIVSVLEGGYKIHDGEWESQFERHLIDERERKRQQKLEKMRMHEAQSRRALYGDDNGVDGDDNHGRKRKRNSVDYRQLYEQMKKEGFAA